VIPGSSSTEISTSVDTGSEERRVACHDKGKPLERVRRKALGPTTSNTVEVMAATLPKTCFFVEEGRSNGSWHGEAYSF
jgi:hypothetical protein